MNKYVTISTSAALLSGLFLISGCSSSDDNGVPGAGVPANAVTIADSTTAETTTAAAIGSGVTFVGAFGIEASTTVTGRDILNIALDKMDRDTSTTTNVVAGVAFNDPCLSSGSVSGDQTETPTSFSGTANFNACNDGDGLTIKGSISGNGTSTDPSGPYNINLSGNLTLTFDANSNASFGGYSGGSIGFNGFNYAASGDDSNGSYTVTTFTYALAPSNGGGFAVQLSQPLVGNELESCELTSGQVLVSGAGGSQARGTVNPNGTVTVEYHNGDGNFVESANSPLPCLL